MLTSYPSPRISALINRELLRRLTADLKSSSDTNSSASLVTLNHIVFGNHTIFRLRSFQMTTKSIVWEVLRPWKATIRARVLPRVIFLEVRRLELRDFILMISISHRRYLEISLHSLSYLAFGFLPGHLLSERYMLK